MSDGAQPAKSSLMLDYVSPNPIVVLWRSASAKHWPVFIAVLGSQLIILATVLSTGLFVLQRTVVLHNNAPMHVDGRFDDSEFNAALVNGLPVLAVSSLMSGNLTVPYPSYTNEEYAIEPFYAVERMFGKSILEGFYQI